MPLKNKQRFCNTTFSDDEVPVVVEMVVSVTAIVVDMDGVCVEDEETVVPVVHWTLAAQSQFFEESFQRRPDAQAYS